MTLSPRSAAPFVAVGIAFLVIGLSGSHALIYIGIVFIIIGISRSAGAR